MQQNYDGLTIVGLAQGGAATLLVALQASPTAAVVASGYSILQDQVNYAGFEQMLIPKNRVTFAAARVRELMASNLTRYLFTWGRNEGDFNKLEADLGPTSAYFASVPGFRAQVHDGGSEFPMPAVASYLAEQLRRVRFRATAVVSSGNHFSTTWIGLQVARSYEVQASSNFLTWESVRLLTNGEASLYFEYVPGHLETKRFFRLRELP